MNEVKLQTNLKALLDGQKLSINEFAKRIDYRYESVRQLYAGTTSRIPVDLIERICAELNCDISDLFTVVKVPTEKESANVKTDS